MSKKNETCFNCVTISEYNAVAFLLSSMQAYQFGAQNPAYSMPAAYNQASQSPYNVLSQAYVPGKCASNPFLFLLCIEK